MKNIAGEQCARQTRVNDYQLYCACKPNMKASFSFAIAVVGRLDATALLCDTSANWLRAETRSIDADSSMLRCMATLLNGPILRNS